MILAACGLYASEAITTDEVTAEDVVSADESTRETSQTGFEANFLIVFMD